MRAGVAAAVRSRADYSRAEWLSDAVVHAVGVAAAMIAVPTLLVLAILHRGDDTLAVAAAAIYGATLIAMLVCSAAYNVGYGSPWTGLFRRLDHTAIFLKIAGTYTPFVVLSGAKAGYLLAGVWGAALVGSGMKILAPHRFRLFTVSLCLGMGWLGIVFGAEIFRGLAPPVFTLIAIGGLLYSVGVVFHLLTSLPFHNTIWHVFVLAATAVFYAAVVVQVLEPPAPVPEAAVTLSRALAASAAG
jgi:hemolysin III